MKNITLEMVQEAYKAINGEGKALRNDYFASGGEPQCCGLAAIYLQKNEGSLGDFNHGLNHLSDETLERLEEEPDEVIPEFIMESYGVSRPYIDGWVIGFDDADEESVARSLNRIITTHGESSEGDYKAGFKDGQTAGRAIFAAQFEDENDD